MKKYIIIFGIFWSLLVNAQVGINTTDISPLGGSGKGTNIDGNLRIQLIKSAIETKTLSYTTPDGRKVEETVEYFPRINYDRVLVANREGKVEYINTDDFYAFNLHRAQYRTRTLPYKLNGVKNREIVEGSVFTVDWLDLCVQYIEDNGKYLELKFRPNERALGSNGLYDLFMVNSQISVEQRSEQTFMSKKINPNEGDGEESMEKWFYMTEPYLASPLGHFNGRLDRKAVISEAIKIYRMFFFRTDPRENLEVTAYLSAFNRAPSGGVVAEPYLTISLYVVKPYYVGN